MKNLLREPTLIAAFLSAVLGVVVTFNLNWMNGEQAGLWVTAFNAILGAWAAWKTRPWVPQAFTYVLTSVATLSAGYGLDWGAERVGALNLALLALLSLLTRGQVSPTAEAPYSGVLGAKRTSTRTVSGNGPGSVT